MNDRVLISCVHVFDQMDTVGPILDDWEIQYDIADVDGQRLTEGELLNLVHLYDGVLAGDDEFSAEVLHAAKRLRVISKWGIGIDAIDVQVAERKGIQVLNTPGIFANEIADYALGYLLLMFRQQHLVDQAVRGGDWDKVRGHSLQGKVLGIIGLGSSGRELARRTAVMGMEVIGYDPVEPPLDLVEQTGLRVLPFEEVIAASDVVSLHLPLTETTRHMIDSRALNRMKKEIFFINTSRGALVDQEALVHALKCGQVSWAALDVFEEEPLPYGHALSRLNNVILGSHNASNTHEAVARTTRKAVTNLLSGLGCI